MHRAATVLVLVAVLCAGCGGADVAESTVPGTGSPTTLAPPTTIPDPTDGGVPGVVSVAEIEVDVPELWRTVGSPPEGAGAAVYAPSDNNLVAERLLLTAVPLDAAATDAARLEEATNDLEAHFAAIVPLGTARTTVGIDARPAQQLRFTWEQPREAGVGWRWVVAADTQLVYITFLADLSEPQLYLALVEELLSTARIGD